MTFPRGRGVTVKAGASVGVSLDGKRQPLNWRLHKATVWESRAAQEAHVPSDRTF